MPIAEWGNVKQCQSIEVNVRKAYQSPTTVLSQTQIIWGSGLKVNSDSLGLGRCFVSLHL